ncbi:MAG: acyltransferase [Bdellovibrionales bacterium]
MEKNRLVFVDVGKIFSIFLVIVLHTCLCSVYLFQDIGSSDWWAGLAYYTASRVCVPLFIMLSAVLTLWKDVHSDADQDLRRVVKRIVHFGVPILLWSVFYLHLFNKKINFHSLVSIFYAPTGLVHLWFLYVLIGIYLLSPLFLAVLRKGGRDLIGYVLLLWFVFSPLSVYVTAFFGVKPSNSYGLFPTYQAGFVGYYLLGAWLMERKPLALRASVALVLVGFFLSYALTAYDNLFVSLPPFNDRYLNFLAPGVGLMSVGCFEVLRSVSWPKSRLIAFFSSLVFGVYFVHEALLDVIRKDFGWTGNGLSPLWSLPAIAVGVVLASFAVSAVLFKIQGKRHIFF